MRKIYLRQNTNFVQTAQVKIHRIHLIINDSEGDQHQCAVYKHAKCGMRQVWFVTAMRGNKYQRRLTIDFTTTKPNQIVIVTTG